MSHILATLHISQDPRGRIPGSCSGALSASLKKRRRIVVGTRQMARATLLLLLLLYSESSDEIFIIIFTMTRIIIYYYYTCCRRDERLCYTATKNNIISRKQSFWRHSLSAASNIRVVSVHYLRRADGEDFKYPTRIRVHILYYTPDQILSSVLICIQTHVYRIVYRCAYCICRRSAVLLFCPLRFFAVRVQVCSCISGITRRYV